jgi:hypothetical protein
MKKHLPLLALCMLTFNSGFCSIVSYSFTGSVYFVKGSSFFGTPLPAIGETFTGFFSYDTAASFSTNGSELIFSETPPSSFGFTLHGVKVESDSPYTLYLAPNADVTMSDVDQQIMVNGALTKVSEDDLQLFFQTPKPLATLPTDLTKVGPITSSFGIILDNSANEVDYNVTSLTLIPEPSVCALLAIGVTLLLFRNREFPILRMSGRRSSSVLKAR